MVETLSVIPLSRAEKKKVRQSVVTGDFLTATDRFKFILIRFWEIVICLTIASVSLAHPVLYRSCAKLRPGIPDCARRLLLKFCNLTSIL